MSDDYDNELGGQVLGLRRAGATFEVISERLHLTPDMARALFERAMAAANPHVSAALEADRLERLHMAVWPDAARGDVNAVDRVLRIAEQRRKVLPDPTLNDHALTSALEEVIETSEHLTNVDKALVAAARRVAERVDEAVATGEGQEVTKALYLLPHLTNMLREMLATPAARATLAERDDSAAPETRLAQLRAIHAERHHRTG